MSSHSEVSVGSGLIGALTSTARSVANAGALVVGADALLRECLRRLASAQPDVKRVARELARLESRQGPQELVLWSGRNFDESADRDAAEIETSGSLREAAWAALAVPGEDLSPPGEGWKSPVQWASEVYFAVRRALSDAKERGLARAGVVHLSLALLADPNGSASKLLRLGNIDVEQLSQGLHRMRGARSNSHTWTPALDGLDALGLTQRSTFLPRFLSAIVRRKEERLTGSAFIHVLREEATLQSVRLAHSRVAPLHLFLALVALEYQLSISTNGLRADLVPHAASLAQLANNRVRYKECVREAIELDDKTLEIATRNPPAKRRGPSWTVRAVAATEDARALALQLGHRSAEADHLLSTLLRLEDEGIELLLQRVHVNSAALRRDVISLLEG